MLVIFVAAGVAYVRYTGEDLSKKTAQKVEEAPKPEPKITPRKPAPNATVSASVSSLMTPVKAGSNSSVTVKTVAGSSCAISVTYNNVPSKDSGLITKIADDFGNVTWSWTVDKTAPAGKWPVKVTCTYNKRSAVVIGDLVVTP